jgi:hypothetical protein
MSGKHAAARRRPRAAALLPLAICTTVVAAGVVGGNAQAATSTKFYTAAATPQQLDVANDAHTVTITLFNCDATCPKKSTQSLGSARVTLPDGWEWTVDAGSITVSGSSQSADKASHWSVTHSWPGDVGSGTITLLNNGTNAAYALAPGESLTVDVTIVPDQDGVVNIPTETKQSNDFSGTGNDFLLVGSDPVIYVGTPYHLEFGTPPSDVQVSNSSGTHPMCPPPTVQVVDAVGNLVTSLDPLTVTLAPQPDTQGRVSGLKYNGSTTLQETTVAGTGTATFGSGTADSCTGLTASTLGGAYPLEASASWNGMTLTVPDGDVPSFSVLQYVAPCGTTESTCATPQIPDPSGHTSAQVTGNGTTTNRMSVGVGIDAPELLSCNDGNPFRAVTRVDVAQHSKTVTLIWDKKAVQWQTNNGAPFWNVCFSAPYEFPTVGGYSAEPDPTAQPPTTDYEGLLVDCGTVDTVKFPVGTYPCVMDRGKQAANEVVHVSIPLNSQADPKMV